MEVTKLIEIYSEQDKTPERIMELMGFNPRKWECTGFNLSKWNQHNKEDGTVVLYSAKIKIKPNKVAMDLDGIVEIITKHTTPIKINPSKKTITTVKDKLLIIPLADMHFGLNTCKEYSYYQTEILNTIDEGFNDIVISLVGDFFHTNNFKHTTINDTRVQDIDLPDAWEEAMKFLCPIIEKAKAMETTKNVTLVYCRGNHDETITWAFTKFLEERYPNIICDASLDQIKCVSVNKTVAFFSHGHIRKRGRNLTQICASEFSKEWANAETRLLFTGHLHTLKSEDFTGIYHYQLMSPSKQTDYERDNLYIGSMKGINLFSLEKGKINNIRFLQE